MLFSWDYIVSYWNSVKPQHYQPEEPLIQGQEMRKQGYSVQPLLIIKGFWIHYIPLNSSIQSVSKKTDLKKMCDFLTQKMLWRWSKQKMLKLEFLMVREKKGSFWPMRQKGNFLLLFNAKANGNIFRVKKSHIFLKYVFWDALYE